MGTTRIDVRLANQAWEAVMSAHATLLRVFAAEGMWSKISMREYDVLYTLSKHQEPIRICEVQNGVMLSQPALSRMIERLSGRGLVERHSDAEDGRAVRVSLTDLGAELQREVGQAHAKSVARELGVALTEEEMRALRGLAQKLAAN